MSRIKDFLQKCKNSKFVKDLLITVIGQLLVLLVTFGLNKIISNAGTVEEFGIYNTIKKASSVIAYVMLMAMGIALPKYMPEARARDDEKGGAYFLVAALIIMAIVSVLIIAVLALFQKQFSRLLFSNSGFSYYILPTACYSLSIALTNLVYSYYRAVEKYYHYNIAQIVGQVLTFLPILFLADNLIWLLWVWTIVFSIFSLVIILLGLLRVRGHLKPFDNKLLLKSSKELLVYCTPRVPGEIVLFAFSLVPLIVVTNKFDLTQTGYFSSAVSINAAFSSLFSFVGIILLPSVSKSMVKDDIKSVVKQILVIAAVFFVIALLIIGFVFLFPKFIVSVLYSNEYWDAIPLIKIICLAILPNAFYMLFRNPLDAISKFPYNTICLAISFTVTILCMTFAPTINACAWWFVIGYLVLGVLSACACCVSLILKKRKIAVRRIEADGGEATNTERVEETKEESNEE